MFSVSVANPGWDSPVAHYNPCWSCLGLLCFREPEVLSRRKWSYSSVGGCIFLATSFGSLHQGLVLSVRLTQHRLWSLQFQPIVFTFVFGYLIKDINRSRNLSGGHMSLCLALLTCWLRRDLAKSLRHEGARKKYKASSVISLVENLWKKVNRRQTVLSVCVFVCLFLLVVFRVFLVWCRFCI